jgi:hypothetical protein
VFCARRRRSASTAAPPPTLPESGGVGRRQPRRACPTPPRRRPSRRDLELTTGAPRLPRRAHPSAALRPGRRYPVVVHVYGGPHSLMVQADERHYLLDQWIADHGCVVVAHRQPRHAPPRPGLGASDQGWFRRRASGRPGRWFCRRWRSGFPELDLDRVGGLRLVVRRLPWPPWPCSGGRTCSGGGRRRAGGSTGWTTTPTTPSAI